MRELDLIDLLKGFGVTDEEIMGSVNFKSLEDGSLCKEVVSQEDKK